MTSPMTDNDDDQDDQDEQEYQQLQQYMPKDLMNMIIRYVPLVEFEWKPVALTYDTQWNTNIYWNGQFTFGHWTSNGPSIRANHSVIDMYDTYTHGLMQESYFSFDHIDFEGVI